MCVFTTNFCCPTFLRASHLLRSSLGGSQLSSYFLTPQEVSKNIFFSLVKLTEFQFCKNPKFQTLGVLVWKPNNGRWEFPTSQILQILFISPTWDIHAWGRPFPHVALWKGHVSQPGRLGPLCTRIYLTICICQYKYSKPKPKKFFNIKEVETNGQVIIFISHFMLR